MNDVELLKIGQRYIVDGKFNYGKPFIGMLAAVSPNFLGWTDCEKLASCYGEGQTNFITNINFVSTCAPVEK